MIVHAFLVDAYMIHEVEAGVKCYIESFSSF